MLKMSMVEYDEKSKILFNIEICCEDDVICLGRLRGRNGVIKRFNDNCYIGKRYVKETERNQERLNYWQNHLDEYIELHKQSFEAGDMDIDNPIRKELNYYIMNVQLIEDDKIIKEEVFRYGR